MQRGFCFAEEQREVKCKHLVQCFMMGRGEKHKKVCDSRVQPYTGLGPSKSGGRSV